MTADKSKNFWAYVIFSIDKKYGSVPYHRIQNFEPKSVTDFDKTREYRICWRKYDSTGKPGDASDTDEEDLWRGQILHVEPDKKSLQTWLEKQGSKRISVPTVKTTLEDVPTTSKASMAQQKSQAAADNREKNVKVKSSKTITFKDMLTDKKNSQKERRAEQHRSASLSVKEKKSKKVKSVDSDYEGEDDLQLSAYEDEELISTSSRKRRKREKDLEKNNTTLQMENDSLRTKYYDCLKLVQTLTNDNMKLRQLKSKGKDECPTNKVLIREEDKAKRNLNEYWTSLTKATSEKKSNPVKKDAQAPCSTSVLVETLNKKVPSTAFSHASCGTTSEQCVDGSSRSLKIQDVTAILPDADFISEDHDSTTKDRDLGPQHLRNVGTLSMEGVTNEKSKGSHSRNSKEVSAPGDNKSTHFTSDGPHTPGEETLAGETPPAIAPDVVTPNDNAAARASTSSDGRIQRQALSTTHRDATVEVGAQDNEDTVESNTLDERDYPEFLKHQNGMVHVGFGVWITQKAWEKTTKPIKKRTSTKYKCNVERQYCRNVIYAVVGNDISSRSITGNPCPKDKKKGLTVGKPKLTPAKYQAICGLVKRSWLLNKKPDQYIKDNLTDLVHGAFAAMSSEKTKQARKKLKEKKKEEVKTKKQPQLQVDDPSESDNHESQDHSDSSLDSD